MKTLIIADHLAFSEKNYVIFSNINTIVSSTLNDVCVAPLDLSNKMMNLDFAIMNISELSSYQNGLIIGTTIRHLFEINSLSNSSKKVIYLWELDWLFEDFEYEKLYDNLINKKTQIITRSEEHRSALKNLCNIDTFVLQDFDLEKIWTLLE